MKGGYLKFYGPWDWYEAQTRSVQSYLRKSSGYGINTDPRNLTSGDITILNDPDDPYPWTATKFLGFHALNALQDSEYKICKIILDGAFHHIKTCADQDFYESIARRVHDGIFRHDAVIAHKKLVLKLIRNSPGILQSDVKKHFSPELEDIVGSALYEINSKQLIKREKKGRSFQLWVNDPV